MSDVTDDPVTDAVMQWTCTRCGNEHGIVLEPDENGNHYMVMESRYNDRRTTLRILRPTNLSCAQAWAKVVLFKPSGKYYTEEQWRIPDRAIGPYDMERSPDFRRINGGAVLVISQEPWGFPHLFPSEGPGTRVLTALTYLDEAKKALGGIEK